MFTLDANEINKINRRYEARQPKSLTSQFADRLGKKDAIEKQNKRKSLDKAALCPPGVIYLKIIVFISEKVHSFLLQNAKEYSMTYCIDKTYNYKIPHKLTTVTTACFIQEKLLG